MNSRRRAIILLSILIFTNLVFFTPAVSAYTPFKVKIVVREGIILCFEIPEELVQTIKPGELITATFIEKENNYSILVNIFDRPELVFVSEEYRNRIFKKLKPDSWLLLKKNYREEYKTQWDVLSVGVIVKAGKEYIKGRVRPADKRILRKISRFKETVTTEISPTIISLPIGLPPDFYLYSGRIISIQGRLLLSKDKGKTWDIAKLDQILYEGDMIKTDEFGRAAILLSDETQMKIHPKSTVILKTVQRFVPTKKGETTIDIVEGQGWFRIKRPEIRFNITTPIAVAAIRGTEVNISVDKEKEDESILTVIDGKAEYKSKEGSILLADGEQGIIKKGMPPTKIVLVEPEDAVQWSLYYLGVVSFRDYPFISFDRDLLKEKLEEAITELEKAKLYHDLGELEKAESVLKGLKPDDEVNTILGWISLERQDLDFAIDYFNKVERHNIHSILGLSKAYYLKDEIKDAIDLILKWPDYERSPQLLTQLGYLYLSCGSIDKAFTYLNESIKLDPKYWLAYGLLSNIYIVRNKVDLAKEMAEKAICYNPFSPSAHVDMSLVYQAIFDLDIAKEYARKAVDLDQKNPFALFHYAKLLFGFGYNKEAEGYISLALTYHPKNSLINTLYGFILFAQGKTDKALEVFKNAIYLDSTQGQPRLGLGLSYFRKKKYDKGIEEMLIATLLEPKVSLNHSYLGKSYFQLRRFEEAEHAFNYAKKLDPKDPTPYLYSGNMKRDQYRYVEAVEDIQKSIELNDNRAVYRSRLLLDKDSATRNIDLAETFNELGLYSWGLKEALLSQEQDITNASAHLFLAKAFEKNPLRHLAYLSEWYKSMFLMPVNQNVFNAFNDYTSMLEVPYNRTSIAACRGENNYFSRGVNSVGGSERYAYSIMSRFDTSDGEPSVYNMIKQRWNRLIAKFLINQNSDITLKTSFYDSKWGIPWKGYPYDPYRDTQIKRDETGLALAYHNRLSPGSDILLLSEIYRFRQDDYLYFFGDYYGLDSVSQSYKDDINDYNIQAVHFLDLDAHQLTYGLDYLYSPEEMLFSAKTSLPSKWEEVTEYTTRYATLFGQDIWNIWDRFDLTIGGEYKYVDQGNLTGTEPAYGVKVDQFNPQLGFKYEISDKTILRGAAFRTLETWAKINLSPTHISGFIIPGGESVLSTTKKWEYDIGVEHQINDKTFTFLSLMYRETDTPLAEDIDPELETSDYRRIDFGLERILTKNLTFSSSYYYYNFNVPIYIRDDHHLRVGFTLSWPSGWWIWLGETFKYSDYEDIHPDYTFNSDDFWATDIKIVKELPEKMGAIYITLNNIFDQKTDIRPEPFGGFSYYRQGFNWQVALEFRF